MFRSVTWNIPALDHKGGAAKDLKPCPILRIISAKEVVAKSIKALNHEGHEEHKGKEKLFFVFFVSFVVPFFSEPFATPSFEAVAKSIKALNHKDTKAQRKTLFACQA